MKLKKILCFAMLVSLSAFVSCGDGGGTSTANTEYSTVPPVKLVYDEDFVGEWNSTAVKMNGGDEITIDEAAKNSGGSADDYYCKLVVNSDKTGHLEDSTDKYDGSWSCVSNKLTFTTDGQNGWTFTYKDDGRITLSLGDGNDLILAK